MSLEILIAHGADAARWQSFHDRLPYAVRDVHFTPAYARCQERRDAQARCALYQEDDWFVLQPFMTRPLPGGRYDVASVYGYGGPIGNFYHAEGFSTRFQTALIEHFVASGAVSEFAALHPIFERAQSGLLPGVARIDVKPTVTWDVETALDGFNRSRRRGIAAATSAGWRVEPFDHGERRLIGFDNLYRQSMHRLNAEFRWRRDIVDWIGYANNLGHESMSLLMAHRNMPATPFVAAMLLVHRGRVAYSHFMGKDHDAPEGIDDLLYYEAAKHARRIGATLFHLGGGRTSAPDDSLLAYKRGWTTRMDRLYVYRRVFNPTAFQQLCAEAGVATAAGTAEFFPPYRHKEAA